MSEKKKKTKNQTASKGQWHGGKGSVQKDHDHNKFADNWDKIFGKKKGPNKFDKQGTVHYRDGDNT